MPAALMFTAYIVQYIAQITIYQNHDNSRLCEGKGLKALNFKLSTND